MNVGMLWFDNDTKAGLNARLERAAAYYRDKYGRDPTLCFVHPSMLNGLSSPQKEGAETEDAASPSKPNENGSFVAGGIMVRSNRSVLPNHFWIGVNGTQEPEIVQP